MYEECLVSVDRASKDYSLSRKPQHQRDSNFTRQNVLRTMIALSCKDFLHIIYQGVSHRSVFSKLTLTDRNMQATICLKVVLTS